MLRIIVWREKERTLSSSKFELKMDEVGLFVILCSMDKIVGKRKCTFE